MTRPRRGTTLAEYALILGLSIAVFGLTALSNINQNVDNSYRTVITRFGGVTGQAGEQPADQWQQWAETGSLLSIEDVNAGKLSKYAPSRWLRLNNNQSFKYEIDPDSNRIQLLIKNPTAGLSGNTTSVEGGTVVYDLALEMKRWASSSTQSLSPQDRQVLTTLADKGLEIAEKQKLVDEHKTGNPQAFQKAYNQLPKLYFQFNEMATQSALSEEAQPLAAFITSVTYYNYLSYESVRQNNTPFQFGLILAGLFPPPAELDIAVSSEADGEDTHEVATTLQDTP